MKIDNRNTVWLVGLLFLVAAGPGYAADTAEPASSSTVESVYPGLASSSLRFAVLGELPDGILLRSGDYEISQEALNSEMSKIPAPLQEEMKKNQFFLLEQLTTKALLLILATKQPVMKQSDTATMDDNKLIQDYFRKIVSQITVTDQEVSDFYQNNKDLVGEIPFDQIKEQIKPYVLQEKQQVAVKDHIRSLGQILPITVSSAWIHEQAIRAQDNPVDKARSSGIPSLVDFGASGCRPCDMMTPILDDLKTKFAGKLNVLFVHVREHPVLASRYDIQSIPVQVFFDKNGKEISRHTGFFPHVEIEKKLAELGVQ
ncbi:MAG: thioredoxin family protein [Candidatus Omnitrophica bacterium]|nr:thioredoxin family protein [Candidatus Omnitrophota bacterium]